MSFDWHSLFTSLTVKVYLRHLSYQFQATEWMTIMTILGSTTKSTPSSKVTLLCVERFVKMYLVDVVLLRIDVVLMLILLLLLLLLLFVSVAIVAIGCLLRLGRLEALLMVAFTLVLLLLSGCVARCCFIAVAAAFLCEKRKMTSFCVKKKAMWCFFDDTSDLLVLSLRRLRWRSSS
jgi:hypothetical protein